MASTTQIRPSQTLRGPALWAALLALVLWATFVVVMILRANSASEVLWTRLAFLFASVEAVAFAAGGAMWGASIQRERAEKAEQAAAANQQEATNGRALATAIIAEGEQGSETQGVQRLGGGEADAKSRYARLARRLFPDV
jgi:hypothetical protein